MMFFQCSSRKKRVYIILGQSNAVGYGTGAPSNESLSNPISGGLIYSGSDFATIDYPDNNAGDNGHGIELQLAYTMRPCWIIKYAVNSTGLFDDWNKASGGATYSAAITTINNALAKIQGAKNISIYWNQGEEDALNQTHANAYESNLISLISNLRSDITNGDNAKFILARTKSISRPYISTVRAAQVAGINGSSNSEYIDCDDLAFHDTLHFTSASQNTIAERFIALL